MKTCDFENKEVKTGEGVYFVRHKIDATAEEKIKN